MPVVCAREGEEAVSIVLCGCKRCGGALVSDSREPASCLACGWRVGSPVVPPGGADGAVAAQPVRLSNGGAGRHQWKAKRRG